MTESATFWRKIVKSWLSWRATVWRSGTSNSTARPSVSTYQRRERARSVTGILRWSKRSMFRPPRGPRTTVRLLVVGQETQRDGPAESSEGESVPDLVAAQQLADLHRLEPPERHRFVRVCRIRLPREIARDLHVKQLVARSVRGMVLAEGRPGSGGVPGLLQQLAPRRDIHRFAGVDPAGGELPASGVRDEAIVVDHEHAPVGSDGKHGHGRLRIVEDGVVFHDRSVGQSHRPEIDVDPLTRVNPPLAHHAPRRGALGHQDVFSDSVSVTTIVDGSRIVAAEARVRRDLRGSEHARLLDVRVQVHLADLSLQRGNPYQRDLHGIRGSRARGEEVIESALRFDQLRTEGDGAALHLLEERFSGDSLLGSEAKLRSELEHVGGPGIAVQLS